MPKNLVSSFYVFERGDRRSAIIAGGVTLAAVLFAWYAASWQIGNMLAELTPPSRQDSREVASMAIALAPSDPAPRWLLATKEKEKFTPESIENSTRLFEEVVRRSPHDYRWWIELGRAFEQAEQPANAESAFRRAVELAPAYTFPRWQFGNFYLRQNRTDEAFTELKMATEQSHIFREQVFSLAWDYFDKDPAKVEALAADKPDVKASLAGFYAARNSPADALRVWNLIPDEEKAKHPVAARTIAQGLYDKRFFRQSLEFAKQAGFDPDAQFETISNGGFESFVGAEESLFGWKSLRNDGKLDIATDSTVKRSGARSLRFVFRGYSKPTLFNVSQLVAVEPSQKYRVSFWVRTENLRSGGPPILQVTNGADGLPLAATQPFAVGSNDWHELSIDFITPPNCEGIWINTARAYCGEDCPLIGTFWYDDFSMDVRQ